jgi:protein-L-isoaspartate(D-aspartate) O-methyltransferase
MACLFMDEVVGEVRIGYKLGGRFSWRRAFNAGAPVLNGFERNHPFQL